MRRRRDGSVEEIPIDPAADKIRDTIAAGLGSAA
jgi:hypothetical protein